MPFKIRARSQINIDWHKAIQRVRAIGMTAIAVTTPSFTTLSFAETFTATGQNFEVRGLIDPGQRMSPGKHVVLLSHGMAKGFVIGSELHFKAVSLHPAYCTDFQPTRMIADKLHEVPFIGGGLSGVFRLAGATLGLGGAMLGATVQGGYMALQEGFSKGEASNNTLCGQRVTARFDGYTLL